MDASRHPRPHAPASASSSSAPPPRKMSSADAHLVDKMNRMTVVAGAAHEGATTIKPMARPGFGTAGRPIKIDTNFFRMRLPEKLVVSQYAVAIFQRKHPTEMDPKRKKSRSRRNREDRIPEDEFEMQKQWYDTAADEPIFFNRAIFNLVLAQYGRDLGTGVAYDGRSIAYAPRHQLNTQFLGRDFRFKVGREGGSPTQQELDSNKTIDVKVRIDHAKDLKFDDMMRARVGTLASVEFLAALDNVLANSPMKKYVQVGRSFYSPADSTPLSRGKFATVSAWRGFYQSARLTQVGLVLNVDESFTTFWNLGGRSLMEMITQASDGRDPWRDRRTLAAVTAKLKALKVRAVHNGITYKVHGFSSQSADQITFDDARGRRISISDYFAETYNRRLRYGHLPCVRTHPKRDTYLPLELLVVMEKQRMMGLLSPDQTAVMVRRASTKPADKRRAALSTMRGLGLNNDPLCRDFGLKVDDRLVSVNARVLPPPSMLYSSKDGRQSAIQVRNGQWRYDRATNLYVAAPLRVWAVVVEDRCIRDQELDNFLGELTRAGRNVGMPIDRPAVVDARRNDTHTALLRVAHQHEDARRRNKRMPPLQLVMVVKQGQDTASYNKVKQVGDITLGIPTQVVLCRNLRNPRGLGMYCENVILKLNSKLGGQNARVATFKQSNLPNVPDVPFLNIPHIILGADVTHPMPGGRTPSVAALVGSRDREGIQYSASIRNQPSRQEVIADLGDMFKEVYTHWLNNFGNKVHTKRVVMFRDGVSEGQFEEVMTKEVQALRRACQEVSPNCNPLITYIIVTKRHHTKLFPERGPDADRNGNVLPGTVVDRDITSGEFYDFYLNSHSGIQGTNKPSKYTVLVDESNMSVDELQAFVYRLAHGFSRCNRSVSMVNSAYYAHLLAFRGRAYLADDMSSDATSTSSGDMVPSAPKLDELLARRLFFV